MSKTIDLGRVVGNSAYEDAVANGYVGTLEQWLASLKGEKGARGEQGIQGIQGERGLQGVQGIQGVAGQDGQNGVDGQDGQDGYSPTVSLSKNGKTTTLVITDKNGEHTATIIDGNDGQNGADGRDGTNGTNGVDGQDGVSPAVTIETIQGGHRVNITDAEHPQGQNFDVMDGQDVTEIFWATYNTTTVSEIQAALDAGKTVMCKYSNRIYTLDEIIANDRYNFHAFSGAGNNCRRIYILINTNTWGNSSVNLENTGARISSTSSTNPSDSNYYSALATKNLIGAVDAKIEGPWTKIVDTILEEDTTNTGFSVNLNKDCSKLKIIAVFPANESLSSNTSCYIGMTGHSGSTTLMCGSSPLRSTPAKVIAEYTYESGLGWQGVITQFATTATFNEDGNNAYSVIYTNLRGENVGAVYSVRIYGDDVPLIAGTKIQIWGK